METRTITITGERLAAMYDNDMAIWGTPNTYEPYWASQPSWMYDVCLATVDQLLLEIGCDDIDEHRQDQQEYTFEIMIP